MDNAIYLGMLPLSPRVASEPLYLDICKECLTATGWEGASQDISLVHYPKQYVYYILWNLVYGSLLLPLPSRKNNLNCWQSMFGKDKFIEKTAPGSYLLPKKHMAKNKTSSEHISTLPPQKNRQKSTLAAS